MISQVFFGVLISLPLTAKQKNSVVCNPRVPVIELEQALKRAKQYLNNSDKHFVDFIQFQCSENKAYWDIGFRLRAYESGHYFIRLFMDGVITTSISKDG